MFAADVNERPASICKLTFNISGAVLKFILKFGNQQSPEGLKDKETPAASQQCRQQTAAPFPPADTHCALLLGCLDLR